MELKKYTKCFFDRVFILGGIMIHTPWVKPGDEQKNLYFNLESAI